MAKLVIRSTEGTSEFTLDAHNSIGRSSENIIQVLDALISKKHCIISRTESGAYVIRDVGSRNGTFLNNQLIQGEVALENGDEITLGLTSCLFRLEKPEETVILDGDDRFEVTIFDQVEPAAAYQSRFLPEREIVDETTLRTDYEKLRVAAELNRDIGLEFDLDRIFNRILAHTFDVLECDQAVILLSDDKGEMSIRAFKTRKDKDHLIVSSTIIKRIQRDKVGIISGDALADERFQEALSIVAQKIRSSMAVPIIYEEELLGIMVIESSSKIMAYTKKDLFLFSNIAHQTANLIKMAEMAKKIEADAVTRERFQRLLSPNLAEMVVSGKLKVERGGESRTATTLFADIRGFTSMCENMEAADVLVLLNQVFELMVEIVFSYEGTVDKFVGDQIMVVWGAPVNHSDDAVRAVRAALDIQAALDMYNKKSEREIQIGIGINTGNLVAGYIGSSRTMSYSVIGDTVNVAARLCSAAGPSQTLISEETYSNIYDHFDVLGLEPLYAKGKSTPLKVYRVLSAKHPVEVSHRQN